MRKGERQSVGSRREEQQFRVVYFHTSADDTYVYLVALSLYSCRVKRVF